MSARGADDPGAQGTALEGRAGYGAGNPVQPSRMSWGWDNLGRAGLLVLPRGFGKGPEGMPASAAVRGVAPARRDAEVPSMCEGAPGGTGRARQGQRACGAFLAFPACCLLSPGGAGAVCGGVRVASPCSPFSTVLGGMCVGSTKWSTEGTQWLRRDLVGVAGSAAPARSWGVRCVRGAVLSSGQGIPVPSWDLGQDTRADLWAWHPRVLWDGSLCSQDCQEPWPLSVPAGAIACVLTMSDTSFLSLWGCRAQLTRARWIGLLAINTPVWWQHGSGRGV